MLVVVAVVQEKPVVEQVFPDMVAALVFQELRGDHGTDRVQADVLGRGRAATVAEEPRERVGAARLEGFAEHVAVGHGSQYCRSGATSPRPPICL